MITLSGIENESLYYYVSRCNKVRRELVGWDIFTPDVYSGINSTFAHKWMTQPFPKLFFRKHKKYRRFNDVEREVHQFWKKMDQLSEWKGNDLLINARVYDSALTIQEFLTN